MKLQNLNESKGYIVVLDKSDDRKEIVGNYIFNSKKIAERIQKMYLTDGTNRQVNIIKI